MRIVKTAIIFLFLFIILSCSRNEIQVQRHTCSELAKTFFKQPYNVRIKDFGTHNINKQYAIYICGNQYIHPPMLQLAGIFVNERDGIVLTDYLRSRLLETEDDITVQAIIILFNEIDKQKKYNIVSDNELVLLLKEKISYMKDDDWKNFSQKILTQIITGSKK